jgi:DNA-binding Lrp family transcriptional regulator
LIQQDIDAATLSTAAEHTGWSPARVKRRMAALEASGTLAFDVDLLPDRLGFNINLNVNAMLWLTTPQHHAAVAAADRRP